MIFPDICKKDKSYEKQQYTLLFWVISTITKAQYPSLNKICNKENKIKLFQEEQNDHHLPF